MPHSALPDLPLSTASDDLVTLIVEQTVPLTRAEVQQTVAALPPTLAGCHGQLTTYDHGALAVDATPAAWRIDEVNDALMTPAMMTISGTEAADVAAVAVRLGCP